MFKPIDPNHNFIDMEKKWLKHWYEGGTIQKYLKKNKNSQKRFSFQDGPITANNPMGVHHAWGRTYKDLWQKFFNLLGYRQRFQNGFDCQGLWVEVEVEKELGLRSKKDIENLVSGDRKASITKFVDLCKQRVYKFAGIQTEQTKRLGNFMDWDNSYFTMSDENNYMIWHFLKKCYEYGWIYKGHESVPWCPRCETAISQHEMLTEDYKEVVHESVYFELPISNNQFQNTFLLIWTTTPWTIPANIAVAVDEKLEYSLVEGQTGDLFWVAKDLVEKVFKGAYKQIVKTVKGKELVGLKYKGPFDDLPAVAHVAKEHPETFHTVIATDETILPISTEEGTGLVHTAVSAGVEDFKLGKKYGLPMIPVIGDNADYLEGLGEFTGKNAKKHPRLILDYLEKNNHVFEIHNYKHRYPACWRCKAELVWKVADEWYVAMDKPSQIPISKSQFPNKSKNSNSNSQTLRQRMVNVARQIKWMPEFGLDRELDWLKNMHDWLISKKNRYWGLALPIYECKNCNSFEIIGSKEELKERAVKGWDIFEGKSPHKPYIDDVVIVCKTCGLEIKRIDDVGNPWLDAGIVPYSTITEDNKGEPLYKANKEEWKKWFPVDFITESFPGQFKNWFYAMIAMSTVLENTNPFQRVLGFATLLGEDGRPMHKSWGNSIEFNEGADKIGVDVMRWMYARQNPSDNMLFGYKKADEVRRQFYLMLWNVYKFFVEYYNLDKLRINNQELRIKKPQNILDLWIIARFTNTVKHVEEKLREFHLKEAMGELEKFISDISTWYIRRSRDRIWVNSDNHEDKEQFYQTLYSVLVHLSVVLSPILPFLSEEIYSNLTGKESVHLTDWPEISLSEDNGFLADMNLVREIVEIGHRVRKEQKIKVRQPMALFTIFAPKNKKFIAEKYADQYVKLIQSELNVKRVVFEQSSNDIIAVEYDTNLTEELLLEGKVRDLIRQIQELRKSQGVKPHESVRLTIPSEFKTYADFIKKKVLAETIAYGDTLTLS